MAVKMLVSELVFLFIFAQTCQSAKLTVPRILLPYNTGVSTNYTLEVKDGSCYKWSSSRFDLVSITPLPSERETESCCTRAVVSVISRYPERENAFIHAQDQRSGDVLRCDVVIDAISSIEIVTTTRVLFLEDAPEVFEVIAKNDQGDTFSSLEGVAFQWAVDSDSYGNDVHGVLRFLKFAESSYKTPPAIEYWEKQNLHGSMILMEGSKTGTAVVIVKPLDIAYKDVKPYDVSLVIVANLNLKPSHVYLLPGTKIKYQLELIKQGKVYPVSLPSDQYYLEVVNESTAVLDRLTSMLTALTYGSTNVVVKDRYVAGREIGYLPSAVVHVTVPSYMTLSVHPGDKWSLQEGRNYFVSVNIYDRNSYPISITKEIRVATEFASKYFRIVSSSQNGTFHEVFTLMPGVCQIQAKLVGINMDGVLKRLETPVTAIQEVTIYEKIKILPPITFLPWDPVSKPSYLVHLTATGGTGSYKWVSSDTSIASVDDVTLNDKQETKVKTFGKGEVKIHASDLYISMFSGFAKISIQKAFFLKLLPQEVEVHLNETLTLPLAMYGLKAADSEEKVMFSDCSQIPILVEIHEIPRFKYLQDESEVTTSSSCRSLHMRCMSSGYNRIRVQYKNVDVSQDTIIVACYKKLEPIQPQSEAVLALGTLTDVVFEGGPKPWLSCKENYFSELTFDSRFASVHAIKNSSDVSGNLHLHKAVCKDLGVVNIELTVGNKPCSQNLYPLSNKAAVKVACAVPHSVSIVPVITEIMGKKCPASVEDLISIHSQQDLLLELMVKDELGRQFYNLSSLEIKWTISDTNLAEFDTYNSFHTSYVSNLVYNKIEKNYKELRPKGIEGGVKVAVTILGYKSSVLQSYDISTKVNSFGPISHILNLNLVEEAEIFPKRLSIFNNPTNKAYLNITKGSGYFHIENSDATKAKISYKEGSRHIEIVPLETGSFSISVYDLCVPMQQEVVALIQVYGISTILVDVVDKVELGKSIVASVEVLSEDKQNIPSSVFSMMNLTPMLGSDIVSVKLSPMPAANQIYSLYHINGLALGQTSLKFITASPAFKGYQYSSELHPIQVFSPLRINPNNITLVIGSSFQVICLGGPHPQANIEYVIKEQDKAIVSTGGRVEAKKLGKTILVARAVGYDKKGQLVVFSQDKAAVYIVPLHRIKIHAPLTRMLDGTEMPVFAMGLSEQETPFAFGSAHPTISYKWSASNEKVIFVEDIYKDVGIQGTEENNFFAQVKAKQDGHVTLRLEVILKEPGYNKVTILSDEVQIQVFKKLKLINPEYDDGMILLSPNSHLQLKCNRFVPARVSYVIIPTANGESQKGIATVNGQGMLVASSKIGTAVLTVSAIEEFGIVQHLTVTVKVEEIAYMMLKPTININTQDWSLMSLPVGFSMPFVVSYHDNVGRIFDSVKSQVKFRANRLDFVRISFGPRNNTLIVQVLKPGFTVLKVWDSESVISPDFIGITAGFAIDPIEAELIVGDVICFGSPLLTHEGHSGTWSSESPILSVHSTSGGALALMTGTATVSYSLFEGFTTSTQVTIHAADSISISTGNIQYITNSKRSKPYRFPVTIQSFNAPRSKNVVGRNCSIATAENLPLPFLKVPFFCEVSFNTSAIDVRASDIFSIGSGFDISEGIYYCSLSATSKILPREVSILEAHVIVSIHKVSSGHGLDFASEQLALPFLPAFTVDEEFLTLSTYYSTGILTVIATPEVQNCIEIIPSDKNFLEVLLPARKPSSISFPVHLLDTTQYLSDKEQLYFDVICHKTKQQVRVLVHIKLYNLHYEGGQCLLTSPSHYSTFGYDWQWILTMIASFMAFLVLIYVIRVLATNRRGTVTSQPVFLNRSNGSFSLSPSRFTPSPPSSRGQISKLPPSHGTPPFHGNISPSDAVYESLGQSRRMWSLDSPVGGQTSPIGIPAMRRRQSNSSFQ